MKKFNKKSDCIYVNKAITDKKTGIVYASSSSSAPDIITLIDS